MEFDFADQLDLEWHCIFRKHLKNFSYQSHRQTYTFEEILKKLFCPDPNDEQEIKYEDKEICEKCLLEALNLLSTRPTLPRQTQIKCLLNITKYIIKDESCFINLNANNVIQNVIYLSHPFTEVNMKLLHLEFLYSFLEHPSGIKWLMDTKYWTEIFASTMNYQNLDAKVSKLGYEILRKLLEKTVDLDKNFCEEIIKLIAAPLLYEAQQIESMVSDNTRLLDGLKPSITCFVEILEALLENYSADVLRYITDLKIGLACDVVSEKSNDLELCLILDRIAIILSFFKLTEVFDGIKSIQQDPLVLSGFIRIIDREVTKGLFTIIFDLYYYALKYLKHVSDKLPKYYFNEQLIETESQLVALQLEPILLEWARIDGATDICVLEACNEDVVSMSHPLKIFKKLCLKTLLVGFKIKEKLPACSFDIYTKAVETIMRSKNLYSKKSLCEILDSLVYSLEAPLKYLQSKKDEEVILEDSHQVYILALVKATLLFIDSFNLNWPDSAKVLDLLYIVIEGTSSYPWIEPITLDSLILLEKIISRRYSPSMALLIDTADGLKNIGPLLYRKCFTNDWKIRNAVLEVVHTIALSANVCFSSFKTILFDASLPSLISTMALNDENASVKATALKCLQQMFVMEDIEEIVPKNILIIKVLDIIQNNTDHVLRKEAIKLITKIYKHEKYIDKDIRTKIHRCLEQLAYSDNNDSYVQKEVVEFFRMVVRKYLREEGWVDKLFPSVTFSKRIIPLTNEEVNKRFYKVFTELSDLGVLNVFKKFWQFDTDHKEAKESLLECIRRFHYNFCSRKVTPESMSLIGEFQDLSATQVDLLAPQQPSEDILQTIINDTMNTMMPNDLEFVNHKDLFNLLDTNNLHKNERSKTADTTSEVIQRLTPAEFVDLVYKKFAEINSGNGNHCNDELNENNVYIIDY